MWHESHTHTSLVHTQVRMTKAKRANTNPNSPLFFLLNPPKCHPNIINTHAGGLGQPKMINWGWSLLIKKKDVCVLVWGIIKKRKPFAANNQMYVLRLEGDHFELFSWISWKSNLKFSLRHLSLNCISLDFKVWIDLDKVARCLAGQTVAVVLGT